LLHSGDGAYRVLEALDPAVRDGDAPAKTCRAKFFSCKQAVEYLTAGYAVVVFNQQPDLFKHPFLAGNVEVEHDVRHRQEVCDEIHDVSF
jgi:hypothetical protein